MDAIITSEFAVKYVQNWTNAIKGDVKLIVHASSKAQKAFELIMNMQGA